MLSRCIVVAPFLWLIFMFKFQAVRRGAFISSWGISILFFDLPVTFLSHSFFSTWGNLPSHFPLLHVSIFEPIFEIFAAFLFDDDSANFDIKSLCFNILFLILSVQFSRSFSVAAPPFSAFWVSLSLSHYQFLSLILTLPPSISGSISHSNSLS